MGWEGNVSLSVVDFFVFNLLRYSSRSPFLVHVVKWGWLTPRLQRWPLRFKPGQSGYYILLPTLMGTNQARPIETLLGILTGNRMWVLRNVSLGTHKHLCQHIGTACLENEINAKQKKNPRDTEWRDRDIEAERERNRDCLEFIKSLDPAIPETDTPEHFR